MKTIVVFVAHSDDEVLGAGGTIAKYAQEGYDVHTIICSFGESSHPHLKPEVIKKTRVKEAKKADKILGGKSVQFLGLQEGKFIKDINKDKERLKKNLIKRVKELKPEKIFSHDSNDSHPDHKAVHKIAKELARKTKTELYSFHIWTILNRGRGKTPLLYIDISDTFAKKISALHVFKSQINILSYAQANNFLYALVYVKGFFWGLRNGVKYAEVFNKIEL